MLIAKRLNRQVQISEDAVQRYLDMGYDIIDSDGHTQQCVPTDINVLKTAYINNMARIAELEAEVATLKAIPVEDAKPKRTRKTTSE